MTAFALTHHDNIDQMAGDSWTIHAVLTDEDDEPLDLTEATLNWTLLNPDGLICTNIVAAAVLDILEPKTDGKVDIKIPAAKTAGRPPGRYTDAMRVTIGDDVDTVFHGIILVSADPFNQPAEESV